VLLETEVDSVSLPTPQGEDYGFAASYSFSFNLAAGELQLQKNWQRKFPGSVLAGVCGSHRKWGSPSLADTAEFGHEIDETRAEEAKTRAKELMAGNIMMKKSLASASALLEKNLSRIKVARKHRSHGQNIHIQE